MIRLMHCISDTNFGGAGRVLLNYLNHFDVEHFDVIVVIPKGSKLLNYLAQDKYRVVEVDGLYDRSYSKKDVGCLIKIIKEYQPDIVHSHGALSARIAAKKCGKKVVYTRHSVFDLPKWQTSWWGKLALGTMNHRYADRIIAVSPAAKDLLVASGTDAESVEVIFNGVEELKRADESACKEAREKYGVSSSDFVCTIMARLEEVKGHDYIIEAAQILKSQGVTDLKILVAGTGGIEQRLKESAASRNVDDIVRFIGFVNDIPTLLSITDVQLNASYGTEATSMALLEGFSLSVPAVVSDFGGNPYVVINEDNGLIFPQKDSNALANAILKIKEDGNLYKKTSAGARAMFDMKFTAEKMTKNMQNIYYQLQGVK